MVYELPELQYEYDALEPHIDERIMRLHHDKHHQGYVNGANAALEKLEEMRSNGNYDGIKAVKRNLSFNLSGHINHSIFWPNMSPDGGGKPGGVIGDEIENDFGSFENFKDEFSATAGSVEGSGWGMLVYEPELDKLMIKQVENHNNRTIEGATPLLVLDVWEHAFYLQYENNKGDYIDSWWNVVNWDDVENRYQEAKS